MQGTCTCIRRINTLACSLGRHVTKHLFDLNKGSGGSHYSTRFQIGISLLVHVQFVVCDTHNTCFDLLRCVRTPACRSRAPRSVTSLSGASGRRVASRVAGPAARSRELVTSTVSLVNSESVIQYSSFIVHQNYMRCNAVLMHN